MRAYCNISNTLYCIACATLRAGIAASAQLEQSELFDAKRGGICQRSQAGSQPGNRVGPVTPLTLKLDSEDTAQSRAYGSDWKRRPGGKRPTLCTFRSLISRPHLSRSTYSAKPAACFGTLTERRFRYR